MFDNIGGKIKILAQAVCWIGIICAVIFGSVMIINDKDLAFMGFMVMIIGSLVAWVSSFTLYGFGQLIENTDKLVLNIEKTQYKDDDIYTEEDLLTEIKKENYQDPRLKDFLTEIKETETADLELILQDQTDLYSEEEINHIKNELASRNIL